jgi:hypothetical protein
MRNFIVVAVIALFAICFSKTAFAQDCSENSPEGKKHLAAGDFDSWQKDCLSKKGGAKPAAGPAAAHKGGGKAKKAEAEAEDKEDKEDGEESALTADERKALKVLLTQKDLWEWTWKSHQNLALIGILALVVVILNLNQRKRNREFITTIGELRAELERRNRQP